MTDAIENTTAREPTETEMAETNALRDAAKAKAETLQSSASKAARAAFGKAENYSFDAVVKLALSLCGEQMLALVTEQAHEPQKDAYVFRRDVLFPIANGGGMIYRDTADVAEAIGAMANGKERKAAAADYVNTKGAKLVEGLARLRTNAFRLADYARTNMGATIVEAARIADTTTVEAATEFWTNAVKLRCGANMARLADMLATWASAERAAAKADKADKGADKADKGAETGEGAETGDKADTGADNAPRDKVAEAMAIVATMDADELSSFLFRLKAECEARETAKAEEPANVEEPAKLAA